MINWNEKPNRPKLQHVNKSWFQTSDCAEREKKKQIKKNFPMKIILSTRIWFFAMLPSYVFLFSLLYKSTYKTYMCWYKTKLFLFALNVLFSLGVELFYHFGFCFCFVFFISIFCQLNFRSTILNLENLFILVLSVTIFLYIDKIQSKNKNKLKQNHKQTKIKLQNFLTNNPSHPKSNHH